jgi:hypothetical protein
MEKIVTDATISDDLYFAEKIARAGYRMLAHGGVLPVHYDRKGKPFVMAPTDPPLAHLDPASMWYASMLTPPVEAQQEHVTV